MGGPLYIYAPAPLTPEDEVRRAYTIVGLCMLVMILILAGLHRIFG